MVQNRLTVRVQVTALGSIGILPVHGQVASGKDRGKKIVTAQLIRVKIDLDTAPSRT